MKYVFQESVSPAIKDSPKFDISAGAKQRI